MKTIHRLNNDLRVHTAPGNETTVRTKNYSLTVKCAADFPTRIPKLENLYLEICTKNLAPRMQPDDLVRGWFEVAEGFEGAFKELASGYGFNTTEVISCE